MAKGKFAQQADRMVLDLGSLFNRSIRAALLAGLVTAVRATKHDSSNASVHWMLASQDGSKSRPWQRKTGKINDFRGTKGSGGEPARAPVAPVGYRRDGGKNSTAAVRFVRERELKEVLDRMVKGRSPEAKFYFYHPLSEGGDYAENANIQQAGESAVGAVFLSFSRSIQAGNVRKGAR